VWFLPTRLASLRNWVNCKRRDKTGTLNGSL